MFWYVPEAHEVQTVATGPEYIPAEQRAQIEEAEAATVVEAVPAAQFTHEVEPAIDWNVPAAQFEQLEADDDPDDAK